MKKMVKKYEIEVEEMNSYEFTDEVREEAKTKGVDLPLATVPMSCHVKGMLRQVRQSIAGKNWKDGKDLDLLLKTYAQLWVNDQLGIETTPLVKKVKVTKFEDIPEKFLRGDKE